MKVGIYACMALAMTIREEQPGRGGRTGRAAQFRPHRLAAPEVKIGRGAEVGCDNSPNNRWRAD